MALGITGYVKNRSDGSVEVLAQSESEGALEDFQQRLKTGPSFARVDDITISEQEANRHYGDFVIE